MANSLVFADPASDQAVFQQADALRDPLAAGSEDALLSHLRQVHADLAERERELAALKADLDRREAMLMAEAKAFERTRATFDSKAGERQRLEIELRRQAETDDLTGQLNRRALFRELQIEVSRSKRYGHPPTLLYLDIDRFKSINDTRGHAAGDDIIRTTLKRIVSVLRSSVDLVGRLGGDEFAILLPETGISGAQVVAERIRRIIADAPFTLVDEIVPVTVSIGIAAWNDATDAGSPSETVEDWVARADEALYRAKNRGRNAICHAAPAAARSPTAADGSSAA